jgi:P27 family predicted phage terminase small subunit
MPAKKLLPVTSSGIRNIAGTPITEPPPPPEWMNELAAAKFTEVAGYLTSLGAITVAELALVEQYASCYSRWVSAERALADGDPGWRSVLTRQGTLGTAVPTPATLQLRQSLDQLRKLGAALGLAPVDRAKLPVAKSGDLDDPVEAMFRAAEKQ